MLRNQYGKFVKDSKFNMKINDKFGYLIVIDNKEDSKHRVLCKCRCGKDKRISKYSLSNGITKSCGCYKSNSTHKKSKSRLYSIWCDMKNRCYNPNIKNYKHYGERGIEVCNEWKHNFVEFEKWALANGYKDNLTIDRKNVNGNYEPSNCRWATSKQQSTNKTTNRHISYNDKTLTISEWSKIIGISSNALSKRISKWGIERALSTIPINNITLYEYNGETHNLAEWCNILNLEYTTIHSRIKKHNWSIKKAFENPIRKKRVNNL